MAVARSRGNRKWDAALVLVMRECCSCSSTNYRVVGPGLPGELLHNKRSSGTWLLT